MQKKMCCWHFDMDCSKYSPTVYLYHVPQRCNSELLCVLSDKVSEAVKKRTGLFSTLLCCIGAKATSLRNKKRSNSPSSADIKVSDDVRISHLQLQSYSLSASMFGFLESSWVSLYFWFLHYFVYWISDWERLEVPGTLDYSEITSFFVHLILWAVYLQSHFIWSTPILANLLSEASISCTR